MVNIFSTYRQSIASLLVAWMGMIIISGIIFIHKEVTSTGEIVIHVHPYDFTDKTKKHQHHSDEEIQFLNVLFHGSFIANDLVTFETPIFAEFAYPTHTAYRESLHTVEARHYDLRGPPTAI